LSLRGFSVFFQHDISFSPALAAQILKQKKNKTKKYILQQRRERVWREAAQLFFFLQK
jgi:hypothetical protein